MPRPNITPNDGCWADRDHRSNAPVVHRGKKRCLSPLGSADQSNSVTPHVDQTVHCSKESFQRHLANAGYLALAAEPLQGEAKCTLVCEMLLL